MSKRIDDLLNELETDARNRARDLEGESRLPDGFTGKHYGLTPTGQRELERLRAAHLLATDAATYVDLVNGRAVPRHRLNANYLYLLERWAA
jgi:hypothetical protein